MLPRTLAAALLVMSLGCSPSAVVVPSLDEFAVASANRLGLPGLAIAVVRGGQVTQAVYGRADIAAGTPVTADTPFQIASTTKPFTASGLLLLVAAGQLSLDARIGDLVDDLPEPWRAVTVRQLMSHTSGLPDVARVTGQIDLIANNWPEAFDILRAAPMQFAPGERWAYTQTNYVLLALIVERISGLPFERYMEERVFRPLGMSNTFFAGADDASRACATNYEKSSAGAFAVRALAFPQYVQAAGGLCTSLNDFVRWNAALDAGQLLPREIAQLMWTLIPLNDGSIASISGSASYGLGWAIETAPDRRAAGHSGGNSTAFRRLLDLPLTVIVLHNGVADPDALVSAVVDRTLNPSASSHPQAQLWDGASAGDLAQVRAALDAGADVNALDTRTSRNGRRALNWAAINNDVDVIELLLERGAEINGSNRSGFTALHHAAEAGSTEAAQALLARGANPSLRNAAGSLPSEIAEGQGHAELAGLLAGHSGQTGQ